MTDHERFYWTRVTDVARAALPTYLADEKSSTDAVKSVGRGLGPARRADAAWMVELIAERLDEDERTELVETARVEAGSP
ncbi:hypothetical protein ACLI4Q_15135 [Natrialbaceae archaeon A-CW1-1]